MKPRLCKAGVTLREQIDRLYPDRDKRSDGWIADARHLKAGNSDHIPNGLGVVYAIDIDRDLSGAAKPDLMPYLADHLRRLARTDKRIKYIIFNGRIASAKSLWRFRNYKGSNPHNHHCHISFTELADKDHTPFHLGE